MSEPNTPPVTAPAVASSDLLGHILAELSARRGSAEAEAVRARRAGDTGQEAGWHCRAAGLGEAIAVVQMFIRISPNAPAQRPPAKDV